MQDNGEAPTYYKVYLRSAALVYSLEETNCDASVADNVATRSCSMSYDTLTATPYSLIQGSSVFVKIISGNQFGDSVISDAGNGATISVPSTLPTSVTATSD
jgi:hypothetical protein